VAARDHQARGLAGFLAQSDKRGPASVIVFAPPEPGAWLSAVTRAASRRQMQVANAVDGVADTVAPPRWLGLFRSERQRPGVRAAALDHVLLALGRARIQVVLLDRSTGRALGALGQRAMVRGASKASEAQGSAA
jgi:hypothetical protein